MPEKIKEAFEAVSDTKLFVDEADFRNQLKTDPKAVFDLFNETDNTKGLFVDYSDFETQLDLKKKESSTSAGGISPKTTPSTFGIPSKIGGETGTTSKSPLKSEEIPVRDTSKPIPVKPLSGDMPSEVDKIKEGVEQVAKTVPNVGRKQAYTTAYNKYNDQLNTIGKKFEEIQPVLNEVELAQTLNIPISPELEEQYNAILPAAQELQKEYQQAFDKATYFQEALKGNRMLEVSQTDAGFRERFMRQGLDNLGSLASNAIAGTLRVVKDDLPPHMKLAAEKAQEIAQREGDRLKARAEYTTALMDEKDNYLNKEVGDIYEQKGLAGASEYALKKFTESLPVTLGIMGASMTGAGGAVIANTALFGGSANQRYEELSSRENMTEEQKITNALGYGTAELLFEGVLSSGMGQVYKQMIKTMGKEAAEKAIKKNMVDIITNGVKKYMPLSGAVIEGAGEGATELTQNLIDKFTDPEKKDIDVMDGVANAAAIGFAGGAAISSPTLVTYINRGDNLKKSEEITKKREAIQNELNADISPETRAILEQTDSELQEQQNDLALQDRKVLTDQMTETQKEEVKVLFNDRQNIDNAIQESQSEEVKEALQEKKDNVSKVIDEIYKEAEKQPIEEYANKSEKEKEKAGLLNEQTTSVTDPTESEQAIISLSGTVKSNSPLAKGVVMALESGDINQVREAIETVKSQYEDSEKTTRSALGDELVDAIIESDFSPLQKELKKIGASNKLIAAIPKDTNLREPLFAETKNIKKGVLDLIRGYHSKDNNEIVIGKVYSSLFGGRDKVLLHEAVHAATVVTYDDIISNPQDYTTEQAEAAYDIQKIVSKYVLRTSPKLRKVSQTLYGLQNPYEFMADFISNPEFRDYVSKNSPDKDVNVVNYIWNKILTMLGFKKSEVNQELIDDLQNKIDQILDASAAKQLQKGKPAINKNGEEVANKQDVDETAAEEELATQEKGETNEGKNDVGNSVGGDKIGLILYHGSPHSFDNFDISKLGSGEGAQAFGYGLYFTNEADIAKGYANKLGSKKNFWEALQNGHELSLSKDDYNFIKEELDALGFDGGKAEGVDLGNILVDGKSEYAPDVLDAMSILFGKDAKKELEGYDLSEDEINRLFEIKKKISDPQFYKVSIHEGKLPSEYDYIDWREPLTDSQRKKTGQDLPENITGEEVYKALSKKLGSDKKASEFLLSKGIDGISYKSEKGTGGKTGEGRNYVVFDPKSIRVDEINNQKQPIKEQLKAETNESKTKKTSEEAQGVLTPEEQAAGEKVDVTETEGTPAANPKTKAERKAIASAKIDEIAEALKDILPKSDLPEGTRKSGIGQDEIIDLVAKAVKALINTGIEVDEAIKQVKAKLKDVFDGVDEIDMSKVRKLVKQSELDEQIDKLRAEKESAKTNVKKELIQEKIDELEPVRKKRRLTQQIIKEGSFSKEFKKSITEDEIYYTELPNKLTVSESNAIIDYLGVDEAAKQLKNFSNGMTLPVRNTVAQILIKRLESEGEYDQAIDIREDLVKSATEQGQGVQSFALFPSLSPEGEVRQAQKMINKQRGKMEKRASKKISTIKEGVRQINKETAKEVVVNLSGKIEQEGTITIGQPKKSKEYGAKNKVVTKQDYLDAKKALKGKMFAAVIPPELITIGAYHIEAGSRKFGDFAASMIDEFGNKVKPYLKGVYAEAAKKIGGEGYSDANDILAYEAEEAGKQWKDKIEKAIARGDKKESEKAVSNLQKSAKETGLWGKYKDLAANRLKFLTLSQIKEDIQKSPPLQEFVDGLVKNMQQKVQEALPEKEKAEVKVRPSIEIIADAYKNIDKYQEVWDKAKDEIKKKYAKNEEALEQLDSYFGDILDTPFSDKLVKKAVSEKLKDLSVSLSEIVVKHYTILDYTKRTLTEKLIEEAGLPQQDAVKLSESIQKEFDRVATEKKRKLIEKAFSKKERKKPEVKSLEAELIELTNLGAFSDNDLVKKYGEKMGWPKLNEQQVKKIEELALRVQESPDGFKKFRAVEDLLAYQANIPGVSLMDVAISVWYANILSGQNTQLVNFVANMANTTSLFTNAVLQNPKSAKFVASSFIESFKRGLLEATATLQTGYSPIRGKVEVPATLERVEFWGKNYNPANWLKYVRRLMVASDVIMFEVQKEMRAYQLAWKGAAKSDSFDPSMSMKDKALSILNKTDNVIEWANEQAEIEYDDEVESIGEMPISDEEKKSLLAKAELDKKRRVYELIEEARPGEMLEESASFAAKGTYNYQPEGALGVLANLVNQATKTIPPLKLIVPFTNIIANVANDAMNYTPIGFARYKKDGSITNNLKKELTDQEKTDLMVKAITGTSLMVAAYIMSQSFGDDDEPLIQITGNGTGDYKKNYELAETGWQPYSIRVGDKWYSYQYTPLMLGLGFIGQIRDYETYRNEKLSDKGFSTKVAAAAGYTALSLFDMTFLSSLNKTLSTIADPRNEDRIDDLFKQLKTTGKGFVVPSVYTQTARELENWFDIPTKEVRGTYLGDLLKDVPVARNQYFDKLNALGEPVIADTDKIVSEKEEGKSIVWDLIAKKNAFIGVPSMKQTTIKENGKERFLTQEEYYNFVKTRGAYIKQYLEENYEILMKKSNEDAQQMIKNAKASATKRAKLQITK